jgi:hypothetical protein
MSKKEDEKLPESIRREAMYDHERSRPDILDTTTMKLSPAAIAKNKEKVDAFMREDQELQARCDRQDLGAFIGAGLSGVNYTFNDGETPLIRAVKNGHYKFASKLLQFGARIDDTDSYNKTALHWAAQMGKTDLVRMLIEKGANRELKDAYERKPISHTRGDGYMTESLAFTGSKPELHRVNKALASAIPPQKTPSARSDEYTAKPKDKISSIRKPMTSSSHLGM